MSFWSFITFISWCNPWLFSFLVEVWFSGTPSGDMAISIELFVFQTITIFPVWLQASLELTWNPVKVSTLFLAQGEAHWMRIWSFIIIISWSNPRLFGLFIEVIFTSTPCSKVSISIKFFIFKPISVFPVWLFASYKLTWISIIVISFFLTKSESHWVSFWSFISFISWCNPWLLGFLVEVWFSGTPSGDMAISIKLFVFQTITIFPVWLQASLELARYTIEVFRFFLT